MKFGSLSLRIVLSVSALAAVVLMATPAFAKAPPKPARGAPEIDPAGLTAVGTLLVGGLAVARGRRRSS